MKVVMISYERTTFDYYTLPTMQRLMIHLFVKILVLLVDVIPFYYIKKETRILFNRDYYGVKFNYKSADINFFAYIPERYNLWFV